MSSLLRAMGFFRTVTRLVQTLYGKESLRCKQIQKVANTCARKERHGKGEKCDGSVCGEHWRKEKKEFEDAVGQVNLETRLGEEKRSKPDELLAAEAV